MSASTASPSLASLDSLDARVRQYGIRELSDVTLVAFTETATHQYRVHRVILGAHSNLFKSVFVGDPAASIITLPATVCKQLPVLEWMLEQWYAPITEHTAEFRQHQVQVEDIVVYDGVLVMVTGINHPYVTLGPTALERKGWTFETTLDRIASVQYQSDSNTRDQYSQAHQVLPLALYLHCSTLVNECEQLLIQACSGTESADIKIEDIKLVFQYQLLNTGRRMLEEATAARLNLDVEELLMYLQLAEELQLTEVMQNLAARLFGRGDEFVELMGRDPDWLGQLSVNCLHLLEHGMQLTVSQLLRLLHVADAHQLNITIDVITSHLLKQRDALRLHSVGDPWWPDRLSVECVRLLLLKKVIIY